MSILKTFLYTTVATLALVSVASKQANAGQLYQGWNYGIDSFNDGSGGSGFEIKGIATTQVNDQIYVALTGGMPLTGTPHNGINIGWGDLFLNFSGQNFQTASNSKNLYAVRFAPSNTSQNNTNFATGVYSGVSATSITSSNDGFSSLKSYYNSGFDKTNTQGTDFATKQAVYEYYNGVSVANATNSNTAIKNVIGSGNLVGGITQLTAAQLTTAGLNFGHFSAQGTQTFGFSFNASLIPDGDYIANLFLACANDAVSLKGNVKSTPEPTTTAGLFVVGLVFGMTKLRKSRKVALVHN
jgi:hypothetical protein